MQTRRRRRFRVAAVGVVGGVAALAAVHICWDVVAGRRLAAELERLRAAGEPILPADYASSAELPDDENAALLYIAANEALTGPPDADVQVANFLWEWRFPDRYPGASRGMVEANGRVLQMLRRARFLKHAAWPGRIDASAVFATPTQLSCDRCLAHFAALTATVQHEDGDDAATVETLRDMLALARHMRAPPTLLVTHVAAARIDRDIVAQGVERIAPRLHVIDGGDGVPEFGPAWRRQVQELIADLLDETSAAMALEDSMRTERVIELDAARAILNRRLSYKALGARTYDPNATEPLPLSLVVIGGPVMSVDMRRMLLHMEQCRNAARQESWHAVQAAMPPDIPWQANMMNLLTYPLSRFLVPSLDGTLALHFQGLAMRRMAALRLAIRLYEIDHDGARPATLAELVPAYLNALPADPFRADVGTFGYLPEGVPPILYSIGADGDDGGRIAYKNGLVNADALDIPFFLNGDRPHTPMPATGPASGEAAHEDDQIEQDVGQADGDEQGDEDQ